MNSYYNIINFKTAYYLVFQDQLTSSFISRLKHIGSISLLNYQTNVLYWKHLQVRWSPLTTYKKFLPKTNKFIIFFYNATYFVCLRDSLEAAAEASLEHRLRRQCQHSAYTTKLLLFRSSGGLTYTKYRPLKTHALRLLISLCLKNFLVLLIQDNLTKMHKQTKICSICSSKSVPRWESKATNRAPV